MSKTPHSLAITTASAGAVRLHVELSEVPPRVADPQILSLAADAPDQAWAIGVGNRKDATFPLIDRWNGRTWQEVTLPQPVRRLMRGDALWSAVSAASPGNVWIFGETSQGADEGTDNAGANVWLHYDGAHWTWGTVRMPGSSYTSAALAVGRDEVWAFGNPVGGRTYVWHFRRGSWTRIALPGPVGLVKSVTARSSTSIWAVEGNKTGGDVHHRSVLLHFTSGRWHSIALPTRLRAASVGDVVSCGANCAWIGDSASNGRGGTTETIARWKGTGWSMFSPPVPKTHEKLRFEGLISDGHRGLWAVGYYAGQPSRPVKLWHFTGSWAEQPVPQLVAIGAITQIPRTSSFWALGTRSNKSVHAQFAHVVVCSRRCR